MVSSIPAGYAAAGFRNRMRNKLENIIFLFLPKVRHH
jgi:hypothetical protein